MRLELSPAVKRIRFRNRILRRPLVSLRHRGLSDKDAFLASYPRSGSTWLRFLLFETLVGESAEFGSMRRAIPSVGKQHGAVPVLDGGGRIIQTHETFSVGPRRVVYIVRDVRDVALSEFAWQKRLGLEPGPFDHFLKVFLRGRSNPWGSWQDHVSFWLDRGGRGEAELVHIVRFEELRRDPQEVFRGILDFLGKPAEPGAIQHAIDNNSLERMRTKEDMAREEGWRQSARPDVRFINTGAVSGWRHKLTEGQSKLLDERFGKTLAKLGYEVGDLESGPR